MKIKYIKPGIFAIFAIALAFTLTFCGGSATKEGFEEEAASTGELEIYSDTAYVAPSIIKLQIAQQYFRDYYNHHPVESNDTLDAIYMNMEQFEAMKLIYETNSDLAGFRVYYGTDEDGMPVSMIVGVAPDDKDDVNIIYKTNRTGPSLCPTICDQDSPIPQH